MVHLTSLSLKRCSQLGTHCVEDLSKLTSLQHLSLSNIAATTNALQKWSATMPGESLSLLQKADTPVHTCAHVPWVQRPPREQRC